MATFLFCSCKSPLIVIFMHICKMVPCATVGTPSPAHWTRSHGGLACRWCQGLLCLLRDVVRVFPAEGHLLILQLDQDLESVRLHIDSLDLTMRRLFTYQCIVEVEWGLVDTGLKIFLVSGVPVVIYGNNCHTASG